MFWHDHVEVEENVLIRPCWSWRDSDTAIILLLPKINVQSCLNSRNIIDQTKLFMIDILNINCDIVIERNAPDKEIIN